MPVAQVLALLQCRSGQVAVTFVLSLLAGAAVIVGVSVGAKERQYDGSGYPVRILLTDIPQRPVELHGGNPGERAFAQSGGGLGHSPNAADNPETEADERSRFGDFNQAFRNLFEPPVFSLPDAKVSGEHVDFQKANGSFVQYDFKLQDIYSSGAKVRPQKRFVLNEEVLGSFSVEVSSSSRIYLGSTELLRAIHGRVPEDVYNKVERIADRNGRMSFDDLRANGFDIRYDAINDDIIMKI